MASRILMVCTGNICRSPMAESLLAANLQRGGVRAVVESAGIAAQVGRHADPTAQALLLARGIDLGPHRARQLTAEMLRSFDLVLVMEAAQQRLLELEHPAVRGRIRRLGWIGDFDIPDPYRRGTAAFEQSLALIDRALADVEAALRSDRAFADLEGALRSDRC